MTAASATAAATISAVPSRARRARFLRPGQCCVGGVPSWNQDRISGAVGQSHLGNNRSLSRNSVSTSCFARAASSLPTGWRGVRNAQSATPISSSQASASRTRARRSRSMPISSVNQLCSPDWPVGPQINRTWCVEAGLRAPRAQDGSIRSCRRSERIPGTAAGGQVCLLDRSSSAKFLSGWSSPVARQAHNLKVSGSNPLPATNSVSPGDVKRSLPSGESEPSVTLACAPGEFECRSESNQRQSRNGWDQRSRKTIYRRNGVVSRRAIARARIATRARGNGCYPRT
jgi:hypothetical protein